MPGGADACPRAAIAQASAHPRWWHMALPSPPPLSNPLFSSVLPCFFAGWWHVNVTSTPGKIQDALVARWAGAGAGGALWCACCGGAVAAVMCGSGWLWAPMASPDGGCARGVGSYWWELEPGAGAALYVRAKWGPAPVRTLACTSPPPLNPPPPLHPTPPCSLNVLRNLWVQPITQRELLRAKRTLVTRHDSDLKVRLLARCLSACMPARPPSPALHHALRFRCPRCLPLPTPSLTCTGPGPPTHLLCLQQPRTTSVPTSVAPSPLLPHPPAGQPVLAGPADPPAGRLRAPQVPRLPARPARHVRGGRRGRCVRRLPAGGRWFRLLGFDCLWGPCVFAALCSAHPPRPELGQRATASALLTTCLRLCRPSLCAVQVRRHVRLHLRRHLRQGAPRHPLAHPQPRAAARGAGGPAVGGARWRRGRRCSSGRGGARGRQAACKHGP